MDWFEEWFNSPYYHQLYCHRSQEEATALIRNIVRQLAINAGDRVLDAACGKGRHSRTLAELGMDVTGIDLSPNSICLARQFETENLHFDVADIRQVYRALYFDYVLNLFSSFGYFDEDAEDEKCIAAFAGNLKPGGTLLIDYINTELAVKMMKPREIIQRDQTQFHIQKRLEKGFIKKKIQFLVNGTDYSFEEQLKVINRFRFEKMLHSAGFSLTHIFGDYELNAFDQATSPRLILVAQKKLS